MTDPESLEAAARRLRETVTDLKETIETANSVKKQLSSVTSYGRSNRTMILAITLVMAVVVGLVYFVIGVASSARDNSAQIGELYERQRITALCPLYGVLIANDTPAAEQRAREQGIDLAQRREWFKIIRKSYDALECTNNEER